MDIITNVIKLNKCEECEDGPLYRVTRDNGQWSISLFYCEEHLPKDVEDFIAKIDE